MECDAITALRRLNGKGKIFDIIFMAPPYNKGWEQQILAELCQTDILDKDTTIIIESAKETDFSGACQLGFQIEKQNIKQISMYIYA